MRLLVLAVMMLAAMTTGLMALTVEGTVFDAETGEGIEGATVRFVYVNTEVPDVRGNGNGNGHGNGNGTGNSGGGNAYNVFTTVTDANGNYILEELPEGLFNVIARKNAAYPAVRVEGVEFSGDTVVYDIELIPGTCEAPLRSSSSFLRFGN